MTALHYACRKGSLEMVKSLKIAQADENIKTDTGYTVFHLATMEGSLEIVKFLVFTSPALRMSEYVNERTANGGTVLTLASAFGHLEIVKYFIPDFRLNVNEENDNGYTALHFASRKWIPRSCGLSFISRCGTE